MKKRLLSFWIALCTLIMLFPASLASAAQNAASAEIQTTNQSFTDNGCSFDVALSGADTQDSRVFVVLYAKSGQMKRLQAYDPAAAIPVSLSDMAPTDTVKVLWIDAQDMPLAQKEVYRDEVYETSTATQADFSSALLSMIEDYPPKESILQCPDDYEFGRLILHSNDPLPDLNGYHVARSLSDTDGYTILQFDNAQDARDCEEYLKPYLGDEGEFVEPDRALFAPPDDESEEQDSSTAAAMSWGVSVIKADAYAKYLLDKKINRNIIVAVVDTGVDYNHTFLKNRMVAGYDFVAGNKNPMDQNAHGTHVAGTIVDCTPGLTGIKIMPVRVLDASGSGYTSVVVEGIKYAANNGASVINLSLGGGHSAYKDDAVNYAVNKGSVVVVAAGNNSADVDKSGFCPGHTAKAISVAAVLKKNLEPTSFSNYGASVDLAAPGSNIKSSVPTNKYPSGYANFDGTSMAAPHVAACAAMLRDEFSSLTPAQVETQLKDAVQVPSGWNTKYGKGVVNMEKFINNNTTQPDFYAIPYVYGNGSGVELVFQKSSTPISGKTVKDNQRYPLYSADSLSSVTSDDPETATLSDGNNSMGPDESEVDEVQYAQWHVYSNDILKVTFQDTIQPKSTATWFADCKNLKEFEGLDKLDTSKVTDMSQMFFRCSSLTELNLNTFNTGSVKNMKQMFYNCSALTGLNLSDWNTGNVTKMADMFNGCGKLKTIYASDTFTVFKVTDGDSIFKDCAVLAGDSGTTYASSRTSKTYARMDNGSSAPGYFSRGVFYAFVCNNNELVFQNSKNTPSGKSLTAGPYAVSCISEPVLQYAPWYDYRNNITKVTFIDKVSPVSTATWFFGFANLTSIQSLSNLDTSNVKDMSQMFARCSALTALDLRTFNTGSATNMKQMFNNCSELLTLDLRNWNTGNVEKMADMFNGCGKLKTIQVSDTFTVSKVADSGTGMFKDCASLVGGSGTVYSSSRTDKTYARRDGGTSAPGYFTPGTVPPPPVIKCPDKPTEPLYVVLYTNGELSFQENLNAQPGKTISKTYETDSAGYAKGSARGNYVAWYDDAASIKSVSFTTAIAPTSTAQWFYDCQNLSAINNPEYLFTDFVTDMSEMFSYCRNLNTLDLSNFNTAKVTSAYQMFYRCEKLTTIYASSLFTVSSITDSEDMFGECTSLKGGKDTAYSSNHTDKAYARIDGGASAPGYFTSK